MAVASRMLKLRRASGVLEIPIRIQAPEKAKDRTWICRYEIDWPDGPWKHAAHGVDSVQAIILALYMIGSELYTSDYHRSGDLMFDGPGQGYGFPVPSSLRDLLVGDDVKFP